MCFLVYPTCPGKNSCEPGVRSDRTSLSPFCSTTDYYTYQPLFYSTFNSINSCELSPGPDLPAGALSYTAPPGGDSPPSPGVGFGHGSSERQQASRRAGLGDQGEGTSPEGQMPGGAGSVDHLLGRSFFCATGLFMSVYLCVSTFFFVFYLGADSERAAGSGDDKTTGVLQSDATTRRVGRQRPCSEVCSTSGFLIHCSSGSFPTTLCYKLRPHLETHTRT